jgi:hypothetical protein
MPGTRLSNRQARQRSALDQISNNTDLKLDQILNLINDELTSPLRMRADTTPSQTLYIDPISVTTQDGSEGHGRKRVAPPISGTIPIFNGGTVVFPTTSGGSITGTVTFFAPYTLTITSGNWQKVLIQLTSAGAIRLAFGTENTTENTATLPVPDPNTIAVGYVALQNIAGVIQTVTSARIYLFSGSVSKTPDLGSTDITGTLPVANGGTGASTQTAAFDALAPSTTKGDIVVHDGIDNIRVGVGTNGQILTADSTAASGTAWKDSGAGGSGEINVITNPSAASATTGWSNDADHSTTRITSGSPLGPTIPTAFQLAATTSTVESSTSGVYYPISTMPDALLNKKLKVEFYVEVPASDVWKLSVYAGTTRLSLTTDNSNTTTLPMGLTGKFTAYFDTTDATAYSVNFTKTTHTSGNDLIITGIVVGPGIQPQGAVVEEWRSLAVVVKNGTTVNAAGTLVAYGRRVGSSLELSAAFTASGAPTGTGSLRFELPSGFTLDTSVIPTAGVLGFGWIDDASNAQQRRTCTVGFNGTTQLTLIYPGEPGEENGGLVTDALPFTPWASGDIFNINAVVPIAEWAGSGTVNLAQSDVEYVSNSSASDGDDSTSFTYGPSGSQGILGTTALTANRAKRVRFQTPIQATDALVIEVKDSNGIWTPHNANINGGFGYTANSSTDYGIWLDPVTGSTTDVDVYFGQYARSTGATYASAGQAWNAVSPTAWRVRKSAAGAAVGFGKATDASNGLVTTYTPTVQAAVYNLVDASYTITPSDGYKTIIVRPGTSARSITLPAVALSLGREITIRKIPNGSTLQKEVLVYPASGEKIDDDTVTGKPLTIYDTGGYVTLASDGAQWRMVASNIGSRAYCADNNNIVGVAEATICKGGLGDGVTTTVFMIDTYNEPASDGGAYTAYFDGHIAHGVSSTTSNLALKPVQFSFSKVIKVDASLHVTSGVTSTIGTSIATTPGTRDISTVTISTTNTGAYRVNVQVTVDLSGSSIDFGTLTGRLRLVWTGFNSVPQIIQN